MREYLKRLHALTVGCVIFIISSVVALSGHAQGTPPEQFTPPERVDLDVTATFVYPTEIEPGEMFPVYAWINNHSDQSIQAPFQDRVIVRTHLGTYYVSDACRMHCIFARSRVIPPGGKILMHMGDVDTSVRARNPGEFSFSDVRMAGYTLDDKVYVFDVDDTLPATIEPMPFTGPPPVPVRQPLELVEGGKLLRDPNTGHEWLRFNHSVGITEESLQSRLAEEGDLVGFVVASRQQVLQLVLNHLHASGVAARPADFSGIFFSARVAFSQFVQLMQTTEENEIKFFINGVVRDPMPIMDGERQYAYVHVYGDKNPDSFFYSSPSGVQSSVTDTAALEAANATTGVWLVRGANNNRHLSTGLASYADDYLFLPNVLIDGHNYRVQMYRKEGTTPSFVVTDITAASAADLTRAVAAFDAETSRLSVQAVEVLSDWPAGKYDLVLEMTAETDPSLVKIVAASPSAD